MSYQLPSVYGYSIPRVAGALFVLLVVLGLVVASGVGVYAAGSYVMGQWALDDARQAAQIEFPAKLQIASESRQVVERNLNALERNLDQALGAKKSSDIRMTSYNENREVIGRDMQNAVARLNEAMAVEPAIAEQFGVGQGTRLLTSDQIRNLAVEQFRIVELDRRLARAVERMEIANNKLGELKNAEYRARVARANAAAKRRATTYRRTYTPVYVTPFTRSYPTSYYPSYYPRYSSCPTYRSSRYYRRGYRSSGGGIYVRF